MGQGVITDKKVKELVDLCGKVPYVDYYSHEMADCFKIDNPFTDYAKDTIVLCRVDEGFSKAVKNAIKSISHRKEVYEINKVHKTTGDSAK